MIPRGASLSGGGTADRGRNNRRIFFVVDPDGLTTGTSSECSFHIVLFPNSEYKVSR